MERVLTRHEKKPHKFDKTQLSIKAYREFLEDDDVDGAEDSGDIGATATGVSESRVSQKPKETRKAYFKKKISDVPEERLILLQKIKFAEKFQEDNKDLKIKFDTEGEAKYISKVPSHSLLKQPRSSINKWLIWLRRNWLYPTTSWRF